MSSNNNTGCGGHFKIECGKDIFDCFHAHCRHFFQKFADRSLFVRQSADLWQIKSAIQQRLTMISGQLNDPVQVIDTFPLPVFVRTRTGRDRCFPAEADFGCCGFKLELRISQIDMTSHYPSLPAHPHDIQSTAPEDKQNSFVTHQSEEYEIRTA
ncbi:hypothetical protein VU07_03735 [Desulfobulbus sp. F4]|nr:hypothetical protein [Desulfobulbus sp. F4]